MCVGFRIWTWLENNKNLDSARRTWRVRSLGISVQCCQFNESGASESNVLSSLLLYRTKLGRLYTECPTRYRTRHFFNNSNTNEDITTKFEKGYVRCVRNEEECVCSAPNCCSILISGKIIKEIPSSVASGTHCISLKRVGATARPILALWWL